MRRERLDLHDSGGLRGFNTSLSRAELGDGLDLVKSRSQGDNLYRRGTRDLEDRDRLCSIGEWRGVITRTERAKLELGNDRGDLVARNLDSDRRVT